MPEQIKKLEYPLTDAKELLLKAASELRQKPTYADNRRLVISNHLEIMAGMVKEYENRGYEVIVEADTREFGNIKVSLSPKGWQPDISKTDSDVIEVSAYEMSLDSTELRKGTFTDPFPNKESLSKAFDDAIVKIEKIKSNKMSSKNKNSMVKAA